MDVDRPLCNMVTATAVKSVLLIIFETAPQEVSDLRSLLHGLDMLEKNPPYMDSP